MAAGHTIRLWCAKDDATDPGAHLSVVVRMPLSISGLSAVSKRLTRCICGSEMRLSDGPSLDLGVIAETPRAEGK